MKRTLLVLALAIFTSAGCRTMGTHCGQPCAANCSQPCGECCGQACESDCSQGCCPDCNQDCYPNCDQDCAPNCEQDCAPNCDQACVPTCGKPCCKKCCEPCHAMVAKHAPRPGGCCEGCAGPCGRGGNLEAKCPGGNGALFDRYCGQECPDHCPPPDAYDCSPCDSPDWGCTGYRHPFGYVGNCRCICANGQCCPQQGAPCQQCCPHGYCGGCPAPGCCASGDQNYNFNPGPPVAQTAYPYYTLRGPRDYLLNNPPSIGPY